LNSRCKDKRANVADGKEQWSDMMRKCGKAHGTNFRIESQMLKREVSEVFTVLVFEVASVGLDPPPPKKLLMSDGMAGAFNRGSRCTKD
jgi:hypothetical protein